MLIKMNNVLNPLRSLELGFTHRWNVITATEGDDGKNPFVIGNTPPFLHGSATDDIIYLLAGNDFYIDPFDGSEFKGRDYVYGGTGNDTIFFLSDIGVGFGGVGNDVLIGGDYLLGEDNNDILAGSSGNDYLDGGHGNDFIYGDHRPAITFPDGYVFPRSAFSPAFPGGPTSDTLFGGPGEDYLWGGLGVDYLTGGPDADIFHLSMVMDAIVPQSSSTGGDDALGDVAVRRGPGKVDFINDLEPADKIEIDLQDFDQIVGEVAFELRLANIQTEIGAPPNYKPLNFSDSYDGFVYDGKTGGLWYDTGSGGFKVVHITAQNVEPQLLVLQITGITDISITFGM